MMLGIPLFLVDVSDLFNKLFTVVNMVDEITK